MLTANWGKVGPKLSAENEMSVWELDLSGRTISALRGNYHDWRTGHDHMAYPPVSWLMGLGYKARRNLYGIGKKALTEIEAVCPSRDRIEGEA